MRPLGSVYRFRTAIPRRAVWHSRYTIESASRGPVLGEHRLIVRCRGERFRGRSISAVGESAVVLDLVRCGQVLTGTWVERTAREGHYGGAVYFGALQLVVDPTGRVAKGMWVGYDKSAVVRSGLWELRFETTKVRAACRRHRSEG